jgi:hypothetical protein
MTISSVFPDSHFNGVEILWITAVVVLALFAHWAMERSAVAARRIEAANERTRAQIEVDDRQALFDTAMDDLFSPDAFAWPARRLDAPDRC